MSDKRTILLIDYDPESIRGTLEPLRRAGYRVEVAQDGQAGLEAFAKLKPDLVLIEPMVPKKHGFQVCHEIKSTQRGKTTPVLITTAFYRGRKHRSEAERKYHCDDYLEKPIAKDLLLSTCRKFLGDQPARPDRAEAASTARAPDGNRPGDQESAPPVISFPELPIPEDPRSSSLLVALDELSDEEIQARLDDMIVESEPSGDASDEPPSAPAPRASSGFAGSVPSGGSAATPAEDRETAAATPSPNSEPFEVQTAAASESATAGPAEAVPSPDPPGPAPRRHPVPPLATREPVSTGGRSKLPLWIAVAAAACIVTGAGILWAVRVRSPAAPPESPRAAAAAVEPAAPGSGTERRAGVGAVPSVAGDLPIPAEPDPLHPGSVEPPPEGRTEEVEGPSAGPATQHSPTGTEGDPKTSPGTRARVPDPRSSAAAPATRSAPATPPSLPSPRRPTPAEGTRASATDSGRSGGSVAEGSTPGPPGGSQPAPPSGEATPQAGTTQGDPALLPPGGSQPTPPSGEATPQAGTARSDPALVPPSAESAPAPPPVRRGALMPLDEVDAAPRPKDKPVPEYPRSARSLRQEGTVVLRLLIDENGGVEQAEVDSGTKSKVLQGAALTAAERWIYEPATKGGVPVKVWITEAVTFRL